MIQRCITVSVLLLCCAAFAQDDDGTPAPITDHPSYALGHNIGSNIENSGAAFDVELIVQGLRDAMEGTAQLSEEELASAMMALQERLMEGEKARRAEQAAEQAAQLETNRAAGAAFLAENAAREGVTTTESGLQYEVRRMGEGPMPEPTNKVKVHYRGTLIDGTVFDSSYEREAPFECAVTGVIPGWIEGLQLMPVGSHFRFVIPSGLAYGDRAMGSDIGPASVLIFEVELLEITP